MAGIKGNPYVGPRPLQRGQRLYGRDREVRELFDLLVARRIVLLHSPSGAGKSSLVQAALIPRLKEERFDVWRTVRLNLDPDALGGTAGGGTAGGGAAGNRFVASTLASLEDGVPEPQRRDFAAIAGMSLAAYLEGRPRRGGAPSSVALVFDQFEEILTVDPLEGGAKREFFAQLGEALRQPGYWALFALREDFLAPLSPYRDLVPTKLASTYRIDLLDRGSALEAIVETARDGGREFPAADLLVDDLRTMQVQQPDGSLRPQRGPYVEPVQLQVVCRRLWDAMPADSRSIDADDLERFGDVGDALGQFYRDSVELIAEHDVVRERAIREWFGERLLAAGGVRGQVLREAESSGGLSNELIESLLDTHLIRAERRAGRTWYELAHDRLVEPIRKDNAAWRREHLSQVQQRASLWERQERATGLLLKAEELAEGERWAAENEASLTKVDRLFLEASRGAHAAEQAKRQAFQLRQALRIRKLGIAAMILAVVALAAGAIAGSKWREAEEQARIATSGRLATAALLNVTDRLELASLLAVEAWRTAETFEARQALLSTVHSNPRLQTILRPGDTSIPDWVERKVESGQPIERPCDNDVAISSALSPDWTVLASASADGELRLWNVKNCRQTELANDLWVLSLVFSPDGATLASVSNDGVRLWNVETSQQIDELPAESESWVSDLAFSADGTTLVAGYGDGTVRLWDVVRSQQIDELPGYAEDKPEDSVSSRDCSVSSLAFGPDGATLAAGYGDDTVRLWDVVRRQQIAELPGYAEDSVSNLAFSPDGTILALGYSQGTVGLWDVVRRQQIAELPGYTEDSVSNLAFSPDGTILASGYSQGTVRLWDVVSRQQIAELPGYAEDSVSSLAFSPDGTILASGYSQGTVRLWGVESRQPLGDLIGHESTVSNLAFSPDGTILASGNSQGTVRLWGVESRQPLGELTGHNDEVTKLAFSPDGKNLTSSSSYEGTTWVWDIDPESLTARACRLANRNLAQGEWQQYFSDVPYRCTCRDLPPGRDVKEAPDSCTP